MSMEQRGFTFINDTLGWARFVTLATGPVTDVINDNGYSRYAGHLTILELEMRRRK